MQLVTFLANPHVKKVGRSIAQDLQQLQEESKSMRLFVGGVDIAHLAKEKSVINNAHISLSDLCAKVL